MELSSATIMLVNSEQPLNALPPIPAKELPMIASVNPVQSLKAQYAILVTELGIVRLLIPLHP